jgi:hypothetical protein
MRARRTVVPDKHGFRPKANSAADDCFDPQIIDIGIEQRHVMAIVDERPPDGEQPQWRQHFTGHARAYRLMRGIDDENTQCSFSS